MRISRLILIITLASLVIGIILSIYFNSLFIFLFVPFGFGWGFARNSKRKKDKKDTDNDESTKVDNQ